MKLPRDVDGDKLVRALKRLNYRIDRSTGSHFILTTRDEGEHHVTVPAHKPIKPGTLSAILKSVARHFGLGVEELIRRIKI
jgi:predicted RNA binding protein YcfA (HicA-like mRNA interferase family)